MRVFNCDGFIRRSIVTSPSEKEERKKEHRTDFLLVEFLRNLHFKIKSGGTLVNLRNFLLVYIYIHRLRDFSGWHFTAVSSR